MDLHELLRSARDRLHGAPREALGRYEVPRRILGVARAPRIVRVGEAWHLGVLLLTDDAVLATGEITRAQDPGRRGYAAESARQRAELRAAALRGGFTAGETVHFEWAPIDVDAVARGESSGPLSSRSAPVGGAELTVRWSPSGGFAPLARYLDERIELLIHPQQGA